MTTSVHAILLGCVVAATPVRAADFRVVLVSISSPVRVGETVALVVEAEPGAICTGRRQGPVGNEMLLVLPRQQARADGQVRWRWEITAPNYSAGLRGVVVTCSKEELTATLEAEFVVK